MGDSGIVGLWRRLRRQDPRRPMSDDVIADPLQVSTDQLREDLQRLLNDFQMTIDEFEERGEADDLSDNPVLEYAYKAVWPVLKETSSAA